MIDVETVPGPLTVAKPRERAVFSDSAENPRFIQTIPRRGYRFIASVEVAADGLSGIKEPKQNASLATEPSASASTEKSNFALSDPRDLPPAPRGVVKILFSLIQLMYLSFYVISLARLNWVEPILSQVVPHPKWFLALLLGTALVGIPVRLYLLTAAIIGYRGLPVKFLRLFPFVLPLDAL